MIILVVPDTDAPNNKSVLFSWAMTRKNDWQALDLTHSEKLNFEENEKDATSRVAALLKNEPDVLEHLNTTGTFVKEGRSVVALDIGKASKNFEIQGLP
jgi:hypothetical protein